MKQHLCIINNFAAHYRAGIFKLIDNFYICDWYFGKHNDDITKMDLGSLNGKVKEINTLEWHGVDYQIGIIRLLLKPYDSYLLFAQTKTLSTWLFLLLSKIFPKKKVYLWSHGFYGKETEWEKRIKRWMFQLPNGGTFLYGNYARGLMIKEGINPDKLFVIHNSLDYTHQIQIRESLNISDIYFRHFHNHKPTLIFIGRLTKIKRLGLLLDVVKSMDLTSCPVNLVLVGDGVEMDSLKNKVRSLGIEQSVWFYGACFDEHINADLIYNADICVAPGNVGLTAMHTMVYGTPVITHNDYSHQMPEFEAIKEGRTGSFFEFGNLDSMKSTIEKWLLEKI